MQLRLLSFSILAGDAPSRTLCWDRRARSFSIRMEMLRTCPARCERAMFGGGTAWQMMFPLDRVRLGVPIRARRGWTGSRCQDACRRPLGGSSPELV